MPQSPLCHALLIALFTSGFANSAAAQHKAARTTDNTPAHTPHRTPSVAEPAGDVRIATFNAYLNREDEGALLKELQARSQSRQISAVAEIIQRTRPDILLLNEFDYVADNAAVEAFQHNYLQVSQNGAMPIEYGWYFIAEPNTGVSAGIDLDGNGEIDGPADAFGFGAFPGQYGMLLLSRYPIAVSEVRTFRNFRWRDMPNAKLPTKPDAVTSWYSDAALDVFRLSSKSHWDVPVTVNGTRIHLLASHPTPPVFDGPEDRNGLRNHDEIRLWADYVSASGADYLYDDAQVFGGLATHRRFVIVGDLNASADEGDATDNPIQLLRSHPAINFSFTPQSTGGLDNRPDNPVAGSHTASWGMRADYVLPSSYGLDIVQGGVFWPAREDPLHRLTDHRRVVSSDHRLVWLDLNLTTAKQ